MVNELRSVIKAGLETLLERRSRRVEKFAYKVELNERFKEKWLVENEAQQTTRSRNKYIEKRTKTRREDRNPIRTYTKIINQKYR